MKTILFDQFSDMDDKALNFWESLEKILLEQDYQLLLIHYCEKSRNTDLRTIFSYYNAAFTYSHDIRDGGKTVNESEIQFVLQAAKNWELEVTGRDHAVSIVRGCKLFAWTLMETHRPALVVLWNGYHIQQEFLKREAVLRGVPVIYMEKAPLPGFLWFDRLGILGASSFAKKTINELDEIANDQEDQQIEELIHELRAEPPWYRQPQSSEELHARFKLPQGKKVLTFFGQTDRDTQNFVFSSHFQSNREAWLWFVETTNRLGNRCFRIGKHHPMSAVAATSYASSYRDGYIWSDEIALLSALMDSEACASVNSSANMESMMARKPTLYLGGSSVFDHKDVAYAVTPDFSKEEIASELQAWLSHERKEQQWRNFKRTVAHFMRYHAVGLTPQLQNRCGLSLQSVASLLIDESKLSSDTIEAPCKAGLEYLRLHDSRGAFINDFIHTRHGLWRAEESRDRVHFENEQLRSAVAYEKNRGDYEASSANYWKARAEYLESRAQHLESRAQQFEDAFLVKNQAFRKLKKEMGKVKKKLSNQTVKAKKLNKIVEDAKKWQGSWWKRVFHRWRPKLK